MTRATWRVPRWAWITSRIGREPPARPPVRGRAGRGASEGAGRGALAAQRRLELRLRLVVERGLDHLAAVLVDARQNLVRRRLPHEDDDRRAFVAEPRAEVFEELVVDAHVGERPGRTARGRADRHAEERGEEDQADQAAPQRSARGTRAGRADPLVQLDLAVRAPLENHDVVEDDRLLLVSWPNSSATLRAVVRSG